MHKRNEPKKIETREERERTEVAAFIIVRPSFLIIHSSMTYKI